MQYNILILIFLLLTQGCGQKFHNQKIYYPKQTTVGINYKKNVTIPKAWWHRFNIKQLNSIVTQALHNNHDLKKTEFLVLESRHNLQQAYAAWLPAFDLTSNGFNGGTFNENHIKFRGYAAGFTPRYSLNILKNNAQVNNAKANLAMATAEQQATKIALTSQVVGSYLILLAQTEQHTLQKKLVTLLTQKYHLDLERYQAGLDDKSNYLQAKTDLQQAKQNLLSISTAIAKTSNNLAALIGEYPHKFRLNGNIWQLENINFMPKALPSHVLLSRPDILLAKEKIETSLANKGLDEALFFPEFNLTTLLGKASVTLGEILSISPALWVVQGSITAALMNLSQYAKVAADSKAVKAEYESYLQTVYNAMRDVDTSLNQYHNLHRAVLASKESYLASKTQAYLSYVQLNAGAIDKRSWLKNYINSLNNKIQYLNTASSSLDAVVQVYQAIGTG